MMNVLVIPSWYPSGKDKLMGIYHKEFCEALVSKNINVNMLFIERERLNNPIKYLFVPRVLAGIFMMPPVVIIASAVGVIAGAITAKLTAGLGFMAFFDSAWLGIYLKDLGVCLLKSVFFGATIALISCSCGYYANGGAKGVGEATTKAVVWSFVAIVIWDMIFAIAFFF